MAKTTTILNKKVSVGDKINVYHKVKEADKERTQIFKGIVIAIKGKGTGKTFTVRRIASAAVGVERIWPVISPWLEKIEVEKRGSVRRAKLYYLRKRIGKKAVRVKTITGEVKKEEKQEEKEKKVKEKTKEADRKELKLPSKSQKAAKK
jgi:large subunit ribosomal protein L19